jgi:ferredoxin
MNIAPPGNSFHWMSFILTIGWAWLGLMFVAACAICVIFAIEQERRATFVVAMASMGLLVPVAALLFFDYPGREYVVVFLLVLSAILGFLGLIYRSPVASIKIVGPQPRIDERDAFFHRVLRLQPGTQEYDAYYEKHPGKKESDEKIRSLPGLNDVDSKSYHPLDTPFAASLVDMSTRSFGETEFEPDPISGEPVSATPEEFATRLKGFANYLGADLVGCTKLNPSYIYSNIGRSPGLWGSPIELDHPNAIAVAVEMNHTMTRQAPGLTAFTESSHEYFKAGNIALVLARYINLLGYRAKAHVDTNYQVMCVPIAADAGLGELGRIGLLMTPKFGPRVRLAIVTTDLPLSHDKPKPFGVQDFCEICKKCADICPSASIAGDEKQEYAGVEKWQSRQDGCYRYWRQVGTDCAICLKVCPYSHPSNPAHNLVRWTIGRNHLARRAALWLDDLVYGRRPKQKYPLPGWHD